MEKLTNIVNSHNCYYEGCQQQDNGKFRVVYRYRANNGEIDDIVFTDVPDPFEGSVIHCSLEDVIHGKCYFWLDVCRNLGIKNPTINVVQEAEPMRVTIEDLEKRFGRKVEIVSDPKLKKGGTE